MGCGICRGEKTEGRVWEKWCGASSYTVSEKDDKEGQNSSSPSWGDRKRVPFTPGTWRPHFSSWISTPCVILPKLLMGSFTQGEKPFQWVLKETIYYYSKKECKDFVKFGWARLGIFGPWRSATQLFCWTEMCPVPRLGKWIIFDLPLFLSQASSSRIFIPGKSPQWWGSGSNCKLSN